MKVDDDVNVDVVEVVVDAVVVDDAEGLRLMLGVREFEKVYDAGIKSYSQMY